MSGLFLLTWGHSEEAEVRYVREAPGRGTPVTSPPGACPEVEVRQEATGFAGMELAY